MENQLTEYFTEWYKLKLERNKKKEEIDAIDENMKKVESIINKHVVNPKDVNVNTKNGCIKYKKQTTYTTLSQAFIKKTLAKYKGDSEANDTLSLLLNSREKNDKYILYLDNKSTLK